MVSASPRPSGSASSPLLVASASHHSKSSTSLFQHSLPHRLPTYLQLSRPTKMPKSCRHLASRTVWVLLAISLPSRQSSRFLSLFRSSSLKVSHSRVSLTSRSQALLC